MRRLWMLFLLPALFACRTAPPRKVDGVAGTSSTAVVSTDLWWRQPYTDKTKEGSEWDKFVGPPPPRSCIDEDLDYFEENHFRIPARAPAPTAPEPIPEKPEPAPEPSEQLEEAFY